MAQKQEGKNNSKNTSNDLLQVNVHEGHRERVRQKIRANGIISLPEHEVLEYLLFMVTPRKDVNGLAHELIDKFGSFDRVLDASEADLLAVKGVTASAALFLSNFTAIYNKYLLSKENKKIVVKTLSDLTTFFINRIGNYRTEVLVAACFDIHMKLKRIIEYTSNDVAKVISYPKQIISDVAKTNCSFVAIAHNHPGGALLPSTADISFTYNIIRQLQVLDIRFFDSIVVTHANATSILKYTKVRASYKTDLYPTEIELAKTESSLLPENDYRKIYGYCDDKSSYAENDDIYEPQESTEKIVKEGIDYSDCIYGIKEKR